MALGPGVSQLEREYTGRVRFQRFILDTMSPDAPDYAEFQRLAPLAQFRVTPTFLVVDRTGKAYSRYEGATSYLTLKRDLETVIARP